MKAGMLEVEYIKENLTRLIKENAFTDCEFNYEQDFYCQLDFDSLAFSALIVDVEAFFEISITTQDIENGLTKPSDLLELIIAKLSA